MVEVLGNHPGEYLGGHPLVGDVAFELGIEDGLYIHEPPDEFFLILEVLGQLNVEAAVESLQNYEQQSGSVLIEVGQRLLYQCLEFGEVVRHEVLRFLSFLRV